MKHRKIYKVLKLSALTLFLAVTLLLPLSPQYSGVSALNSDYVLRWDNSSERIKIKCFKLTDDFRRDGNCFTGESDTTFNLTTLPSDQAPGNADESNWYGAELVFAGTGGQGVCQAFFYMGVYKDQMNGAPNVETSPSELINEALSPDTCINNDYYQNFLRFGPSLIILSANRQDPPGGDPAARATAKWADRAHIEVTRGGETRIYKDGNIFDDEPEYTNNKDDCESTLSLFLENGNGFTPQNAGDLTWQTKNANTNRCTEDPSVEVAVTRGSVQRRIWFQRLSETEIKAVDGKSDHVYEKVSGSNTNYNRTSQGACPDQVTTANPPQSQNIGPDRFEKVGHHPRDTDDEGSGCNQSGDPNIPNYDALMYPIGQAPPGDDGTTAGGFEAADCDAGEGLTWIICPTVRILAGAINSTAGLIEQMLEFPPDILSTTESTFSAWKGVRNLANVGLVLVFVVIIYSQATGGKE